MIVDLILCLAIMLVLQLLTPHWWWIMAVPLLYGLIKADSGAKAFLVGMAASGLLWLGASYYFWKSGGELIADRMAAVLGIEQVGYLVAATAALALLSGGFAAGAGFYLKALASKEEV